jgi:hypothetical protein
MELNELVNSEKVESTSGFVEEYLSNDYKPLPPDTYWIKRDEQRIARRRADSMVGYDVIPTRMQGADRLQDDFENIGGDEDEYSNIRAFGIGKLTDKQKKRRANIKSKLKGAKDKIDNKLGDGKTAHAVNKFNPAFVTMRGSVLSILSNNVVGMASSLADLKAKSQEDWEKVMQKWWKWGGEKAKFDKAMIKGSKKKALFKDLVEKFQKKKGFDGDYSYADAKNVAANSLLVSSALLGVASPILASNPATAAAAVWTASGAGAFASMGGIFKSFAQKQGVSESELSNILEGDDIPNAPVPTDEDTLKKISDIVAANEEAGVDDTGRGSERVEEDDDKILGMPKGLAIGLGIALLAIGGFIAYKKLKK